MTMSTLFLELLFGDPSKSRHVGYRPSLRYNRKCINRMGFRAGFPGTPALKPDFRLRIRSRGGI